MARGRKIKYKKYFGDEQETAIIDFIKASDDTFRDSIYEKYLKQPLEKMTESIINRYELYSHKLTFDELIKDTLSDLHTKIKKFNPVKSAEKRISKIITETFKEDYTGNFVEYMPAGEIDCTTEDIQSFIAAISDDLSPECLKKLKTLKRTKAYSYFGTVIKHYAMGKRIKEQKEMEDVYSFEKQQEYLLQNEKLSYEMIKEDSAMNEFFYEYIEIIEYVLERNESEKFLKVNEEKMGYAVVHLMKNWEEVFDEGGKKYQKAQVLECLRNMTDLTTKDIRDNLKKFKQLYYDKKNDKIERDYRLNINSKSKSKSDDDNDPQEPDTIKKYW